MINIIQRELSVIIAENKIYYDSIVRIWCKVLNSNIHFNSEGRLHLIYKGSRKKRLAAEQRYKLKLFPLVIPAIKNYTNIQACHLPNNNHGAVQFYEITWRKSPIEIRVIIKRTGDGQFNYHNIIPTK